MWWWFVGLLWGVGPFHVQRSVPYSGTLSNRWFSQRCTSLAWVHWPSRHRGSQEREARKVSYWKFKPTSAPSTPDKASAVGLRLMKWFFLCLAKEKPLFTLYVLIYSLLIAAVWHGLAEKKKKRVNSTFSPLCQTHPRIMLLCAWAPAAQPSALLSFLPPGFLQLAGTIRHADTIQRSARQRGHRPGQQGACLLLPQL